MSCKDKKICVMISVGRYSIDILANLILVFWFFSGSFLVLASLYSLLAILVLRVSSASIVLSSPVLNINVLYAERPRAVQMVIKGLDNTGPTVGAIFEDWTPITGWSWRTGRSKRIVAVSFVHGCVVVGKRRRRSLQTGLNFGRLMEVWLFRAGTLN